MALVRASLAALTATSIGVDGATVRYYRDARCTEKHNTIATNVYYFSESKCLDYLVLSGARPVDESGSVLGVAGGLEGLLTNPLPTPPSSSVSYNNITEMTTARVQVTCEANKVTIATYTTADCSGTSAKVEEAVANQCEMVAAGIYQRRACSSATGMIGAFTAAVMLITTYLL